MTQKFHYGAYVLLSLFSCSACLTLCDPLDGSTPGSPVLHHLLELPQTHVHWAGDIVSWKKKKIQKAPVWFLFTWKLSLVCSSKFSYSVAQSCPTLQPHDCNMPGFPVHHQLQEFTQTHAHWVGDAIQPSHPLSSPAPPAFILSQHQGLFQWVSSPHQVAKVLEFQLQHQSFQWIFRTDFL